ncbi:MAG: tRNA lysidine(34) synthetase TilS [Sumerlaeia bacterium]
MMGVDWQTQFFEGEGVLVGISGGADSVYLALVLSGKLHPPFLSTPLPKLRVVLYNAKYEGRAGEADDDIEFLKAFAKAEELPFIWDPIAPDYKGPTGNLEADLREWRYERMRFIARERGLHYLALGHNLNDVAETFLVMALRGSGPRGLGSLKPMRKLEGAPLLTLIRPLLSMEREEIRSELTRAGYTWKEDSMNADGLVRRNVLRHQVFPILQGLEPAAIRVIAKSAELCAQEHEAVNHWAQGILKTALMSPEPEKRILLPTQVLQENLPNLSLILRSMPTVGSLSQNEVLQISSQLWDSSPSDWLFRLPQNLPHREKAGWVYIYRGHFFVTSEADCAEALCRELERNWTSLFESPKKWRKSWRGKDSRLKVSSVKKRPKKLGICDILLPKELLKKVVFRRVKPLDKMMIKSGRSKTVRSVLQEEGIARLVRDRVQGLYLENELLWIPGVRRSESHHVSEEMIRNGEAVCLRWRPLLPVEQ